jgi:prenyltransferase beta subunit
VTISDDDVTTKNTKHEDPRRFGFLFFCAAPLLRGYHCCGLGVLIDLEELAMMKRILLSTAVVGAFGVWMPGCNPAREVPATMSGPEIGPATAATPTARGTIALVRLQGADGSFAGEKPYRVGITAIAGLAMLSAGDVAPSTTMPHVQKAARFILKSQNANGYLHSEGDAAGMYGHGFATLFLTQLYATTSDEALKAELTGPIKRAVHLIETAQGNQGGWRYTPQPADADVSVTAAQVKALAAAKEAGIAVSEKTLMRAVTYLKSAQQPDGGFAYVVGGGNSGWERSAAATAALLYAGLGGSPDTEKAMGYLQKKQGTQQGFFYYGSYYLAQTMNLGDPAKTDSVEALRKALLEKQNQSTYLWTGEVGDAYATAMALLVLYMPETRLPAFRSPMKAAEAMPGAAR